MEWKWPMVDEGRAKRAKVVKFPELDCSSDSPHGKAKGSAQEDYSVTLESCTCADFSISERRGAPAPCKHMVALAMKCGILNENGLTPAQQHAEDRQALRARIASAFGFYHLFHDPIITDEEYDRMKSRLSEIEKH